MLFNTTILLGNMCLISTDANGYSSARYGHGTGSIVMDDVSCNGTEKELYNCSHLKSHNCEHHEDASVACST